ncbi:hypothetical protein Tco_0859209 [Tanacetum coccineum]|uniref:Uncharacterized protein n=1 Tax=Tanacetum coccineum TaxID=301880 RepID=A0ABQ5BDJ9_9ASTR
MNVWACAQLKFGFSFQALTASLKLLGPWFIVNGLLPVSFVREDAYSTKAYSGSSSNTSVVVTLQISHRKVKCVESFKHPRGVRLVYPRSEVVEMQHSFCTNRMVLDRKRYHVVPYGELDGIPIAFVARFGVISKSTDRILVSHGG